MMLTKYKNPPQPVNGNRRQRGQNNETPKEDGTRQKAHNFFEGLGDMYFNLLPTTVELRTGVARGSGVILGAANGKAYVLTAKHNLSALLDNDPVELDLEPSWYTINRYPQGIKIRYDPASLKGEPRREALVTDIEFAGVTNSNTTWTYDAILMVSTDEFFINFVKTRRFIKPDEVWRYSKQLRPDEDDKYRLLAKNDYHFIQLGYGKPKDPDVTGLSTSENYEDLEGKLQVKLSSPTTNVTAPGLLVEPKRKIPQSKWRTMSSGIQLKADNTKSTAGGDSGGPLFSISRDKKEFYLVGVTTGANWYPQGTEAQQESTILNNVATYWEPMFAFCETTFLKSG